jgi:hypothetical protein
LEIIGFFKIKFQRSKLTTIIEGRRRRPLEDDTHRLNTWPVGKHAFHLETLDPDAPYLHLSLTATFFSTANEHELAGGQSLDQVAGGVISIKLCFFLIKIAQ